MHPPLSIVRIWRGSPLVLALTGTSALAAGTHCTAAERVIFSCSVARAKVVSLCLAPATVSAGAALSYRFGVLDHPEYVFPATAASSLQQFRYAHYFRYQTDRTEVSFSSAAAGYAVYDYFEGDERPQKSRGVSVTVDGKTRDIACAGAVVSHLVELEKLVPCDQDSALSNCQ